MARRRILFAAGMLAFAAHGVSAASAAESGYRVVDRQVLSGPVRWDYLTADSVAHRLFMTRGDHVDVFDTVGHAIVGSVPDTAGVHGVDLAPDSKRGYTSNGGDGSVTVFDLQSLRPITKIRTGGKPDAIVYDPASRRLFVADADNRALAVIDTSKDKLIKTIPLAGTPETAVVNGTGTLFVAIEDRNAIAVVDTGAMTVVRQFDIAKECDEPAGLAIDAETDRLFAGCHNGKMAIVDGRTGKVLAAPSIGKGNDATAYDSALHLAFASNGDGSLTVVDARPPFQVLQSVATMPRARTMALDTATHQVFVVSAEPVADAPAQGRGRAPLKQGTFTLLTLSAP